MLVDQISKSLQISSNELHQIARSADRLYRRIEIPKKNRQTRIIFVPAPELKLLQRWLVDNVISRFEVHSCAMAYRKGRSVLDNAKAHQNREFLLRMDLSHFFPSITANDVSELLERPSHRLVDWDNQDKDFFLRTTCRYKRLLIGAPSSPSISNAVCLEVDELISAICRTRGITYTRYADDLFFSTNTPNILKKLQADVTGIIATTPWPKGMRVNQRKTVHASRKRQKRVTGITITPQGSLSLGRKYKRRISAMVHQFESLDKDNQFFLAGHLAYAFSIEPQFRLRLEKKYGHLAVRRAARPPT